MRLLLLAFAAVLILLVGVFPFVDDGSRFLGGLPLSLAIVIGGQSVLIGLHLALARQVRAKTEAAAAGGRVAGEVHR